MKARMLLLLALLCGFAVIHVISQEDESILEFTEIEFEEDDLDSILDDFNFEETGEAELIEFEEEATGDPVSEDEILLDFDESSIEEEAAIDDPALDETGELEFEEIDIEGLEFLEDLEFTEETFDEDFRSEVATYGFLLNFANEKLNLIDVGDDTLGIDKYAMLAETFASQGYMDFSLYLEDDAVSRDVFAEFLFVIEQKRSGGQDDSAYMDSTQWAVERGFLKPSEDDDFGFGLDDGDLEDISLDSLFDEPQPDEDEIDMVAVNETEEEVEEEIPAFIHPNRIAGSVDVESKVTLKFVTPPSKVGKFKIMKKDDFTGSYTEAGNVSAEDKTFVDADSLSGARLGRDIVQYQVSRSAEDFIVTVTYQEPSGITVDRKVFYQVVPDKESIDSGTKTDSETSPVLPEFLSAKVDFTGNVFLQWTSEDGKAFAISWKDSETGSFKTVGDNIKGNEFSDSIGRSGADIISVNEYQISRTMDDFIISISYNDSAGMPRETQYFYRVEATETGPLLADTGLAQGNYVSRGEVIDAFEMMDEDLPLLRRRLVDLPVFADVFIMPASGF